MKQFKNITEWLASKPAKEEIEKLLANINAKEVTKSRRNLFFMNLELAKIQKYKKQTEKLGFPVNADIIQKEKTLKQEIAILSKELPESKPRKEKVTKEEPPQEEPKTE